MQADIDDEASLLAALDGAYGAFFGPWDLQSSTEALLTAVTDACE